MSPLRVLRGLVFGAMGGLLAWALIEFLPFPYPFRPARFEGPGAIPPMVYPSTIGLLGLAMGLAIGGCLGVSEGIAEGTMSRFRRAVLWFTSLGALGGYLGLYFGQILFGALGGKVDPGQISAAEFIPQTLARSLSWMLIGLFLGLVFGVPNMSVRRMWNGAVGGALGGFLGGFFFQVLAFTRVFAGAQGRFVGFIAIGAFIGFFINLFAEAFKRVWVKVLVGRNEGREHVIDTQLAYIGRDELAEIPVFLDPSVPRRLASLRLNDGRYGLYAESTGMPITVNGQPLQQGQVLRDGDAIQFGRVTLGYYEKATATGNQRPVDVVPMQDFSAPAGAAGPRMAIPRAPGVCEFCGQPRDPATGACACTVAGDGGYAPMPDAGGYGGAPGAYGAPAGGYGGAPDYSGAPGAYGQGGGWPAQDPAYAATMMDPGVAGGYGAPAAPGGARLVVTGGPLTGQVFPLGGPEVGIGREPGQAIALVGDGTASRRHARILAMPTGWLIRDEGSANGTWVNGIRIAEQPLFPGDQIRIGATQFQFEA